VCIKKQEETTKFSNGRNVKHIDEQLQKNCGCYFSLQAMLPEGFPFHQFNLHLINFQEVTLTFGH